MPHLLGLHCNPAVAVCSMHQHPIILVQHLEAGSGMVMHSKLLLGSADLSGITSAR